MIISRSAGTRRSGGGPGTPRRRAGRPREGYGLVVTVTLPGSLDTWEDVDGAAEAELAVSR